MNLAKSRRVVRLYRSGSQRKKPSAKRLVEALRRIIQSRDVDEKERVDALLIYDDAVNGAIREFPGMYTGIVFGVFGLVFITGTAVLPSLFQFSGAALTTIPLGVALSGAASWKVGKLLSNRWKRKVLSEWGSPPPRMPGTNKVSVPVKKETWHNAPVLKSVTCENCGFFGQPTDNYSCQRCGWLFDGGISTETSIWKEVQYHCHGCGVFVKPDFHGLCPHCGEWITGE